MALVLALASVVAWPAAAPGRGERQKTNKAAGPDAQEKAARAACLAGEYKKGVEIPSQLFNHPANYWLN